MERIVYIEILQSNLDDLSNFLQTTKMPYLDDPVFVYGNNTAVDFLHACSEKIISKCYNSTHADISTLLDEADRLYNQIKTTDKVLAIGFLASVYSAISKIYINRANSKLKIGFVVPAYNEEERMLPHENCENGQNAFDARVRHYLWLFEDRMPSHQHLLFVDDLSTDYTKEHLKNRLKDISEAIGKGVSVLGLDEISNKYRFYASKYPTMEKYQKSIKGGSVYFGLLWMLEHEYDYVFFIDFDLTNILDHAGLLLNIALNNPRIGIVSNSRRTQMSKGYCDKEGNMISSLFQAISNELLCTSLTDVNTGFKLVNMRFFGEICSQISDLSLSLDSELIMLCIKNGYTVVENSGIFFHQYVEGKQGVNRDYGIMLKSTMKAKIRHNYNSNMPTPLFFEMEKKGFYSLVKLLEIIRTQTQSNQQAIQLYSRRLSQ